MNHTSGPWVYAPSGAVMRGYVQPFAIAQQGEANLIAGCFGDVRGGGEIAEANARLIAAAPDLLVAAKEMLGGCDIAEQLSDLIGFANRLNAAIKKAEGR